MATPSRYTAHAFAYEASTRQNMINCVAATIAFHIVGAKSANALDAFIASRPVTAKI
jgi:hypothetical protein